MRISPTTFAIFALLCFAMNNEVGAQVVPKVIPVPTPPTTPLGPILPQSPPLGCPAAPNQINFLATPTVTYDPTSGLWTYSYTLVNLPTSKQAIAHFAVDFAPPIIKVASPQGWIQTAFSGLSAVYWTAVGGASFPPGTPDNGNVPPSAYQVQPGSSLSGFSFQSLSGPDWVPSYALGYTPLPSVQGESDAETISDQCRQTAGNFFDLAVHGVSLAPASPYLPVEIEVLPYQNGNQIDPTASGQIAVAIISTAVHSALQTSPLTAQFGPGNAPPSVSVPQSIQDVNGDGLPDLVLYFDTHTAAIPCGAETATLKASTLAGQPIQGTTWITTINCTP